MAMTIHTSVRYETGGKRRVRRTQKDRALTLELVIGKSAFILELRPAIQQALILNGNSELLLDLVLE